MKKMRIAVYGDVNLNIIDGSSIWVSNVAKLSAAADESEVVVYSKAPVYRTNVVQPLLDLSNVSISSPKGDEHTPLLSLPAIVDRIGADDVVDPFDVVIVRGLAAAEVFAGRSLLKEKLWLYLTDIPQSSALADASVRARLRALSANCRNLLCQTEELRNFLETRCGISGRKLLLLPPMVADSAFRDRTVQYSEKEPLRLIYSGKFAPLWGLDAQLDAVEMLRDRGQETEFHIIGDKFHNDPGNAAFMADLKERFLQTPGVNWHGGLPQDGVFWLQERCHVGMALRAREMSTTLELSTKLLEYGASGIAALVNPTLMHRRALGEDYPLFANTSVEAAERLLEVARNPGLLEVAAERLRKLAGLHRMSAFQSTWNRYLARMAHPASLASSGRKRRVVLAGHDLKFCKELIEYFHSRKDVELRIDKWSSLREHDEVQSRDLLQWADTVVCEWCAGNAVWYSENIDPARQKLFVRFHRFEMNSEFPPKVRLENVEKMIFVGKHILDEAAGKFDWNRDELVVIPNFVDTLVYDRPKLEGSRFNLGLIGYVPMLKRLDRAIDILEELLRTDSRYMLFVKGRHPWEYPWIWRKQEERNHYEAIFERLRDNADLRNHVVFDGFGDDIPAWLRKIGFILSTSDLESFHMAAAEGMAAGSLPLILQREGASEIFPEKYIFTDSRSAAEYVSKSNSISSDDERRETKSFVSRYSAENISRLLDEILFPTPGHEKI